MGLDQYAYKIRKVESKESGIPLEFLEENNLTEETPEEIYYWRKYYDVQDFFEKLYRDKGGKEEFNCVDVYLDKEDLDSIEEGGFKYQEEIWEFVKKAREALDEGYQVFYTSWW